MPPSADAASVNWHTLRHSAASQWLRHGADVFSVSRWLGHASASFTMDTYGHLLAGQQRQAAEALDHLLAEA
jgi:site-specific recombinase XerD